MPSINWPTELRETGPFCDPTIMLMGEAKVGPVDYLVVAIRMNDYRMGPDYREGIDERLYEGEIDAALDVLEFLTETTDPALLPLSAGKYFLWMVPAEKL